MNENFPLSRIKTELKELRNFEVVIFGSYVEGTMHDGSDIDIALITRNENERDNMKIYKQYLGKLMDPFELHVFELLPIHIKMAVIQNFIVVFGDRVELSEYFYQTRKQWNDCKHRILENQFSSFKEKQELMKNRKKITQQEAGS